MHRIVYGVWACSWLWKGLLMTIIQFSNALESKPMLQTRLGMLMATRRWRGSTTTVASSIHGNGSHSVYIV